MKSVLSILVILAITCTVLADLNTEWAKYKKDFNKKYDNPHEEDVRRTIFRLTLIEIRDHNALFAEKKTTYEKGLNHFADFTINELKMVTNGRRNQEDPEWTKFKKDLNKTYDPKEDDFRHTIFRKTVALIKKHNQDFKDGKVTYDLSVNKFADKTLGETGME